MQQFYMIIFLFINIHLYNCNPFLYNNEKELFDAIEIAEKSLKIYVYPIPSNIPTEPIYFQNDDKTLHTLHKIYFWFHNYLPYYLDYIYNMFNNPKEIHEDDPPISYILPIEIGKYLPKKEEYTYFPNIQVVKDPNEANMFLIHTQYGFKRNEHFIPILHNVIYNYPYFNQSNGHNHIIIEMDDWGLRCCCYEAIDKRLENVIIIGNYGIMNETSYKHWMKYDKAFLNTDKFTNYSCYNMKQDITIPQILPYNDVKEIKRKIHHKFLLSLRKYDSCFYGNANYIDRKPIQTIEKYKQEDYDNNYCELFRREYIDLDCLSGYMPCGNACWSSRFYDSLLHRTIPIIVGKDMIYPYEKWLNYSSFTIKIPLETFKERNNTFRHFLRQEADKYKQIVYNISKIINELFIIQQEAIDKHVEDIHEYCISKYSMKNICQHMKYISKIEKKDVIDSDVGYIFDYELVTNDNELLKELVNNYYYQKAMNINKVFDWLQFTNLTHKRNAMRLLFLELYCRLLHYQNDYTNRFCERSVSYIGDLYYY